jgi:hypothetical protein
MLKENQEQVVEPVSPLQLKHQNLKLQKNPRQLQLKYVLTSKINTGSNKGVINCILYGTNINLFYYSTTDL